MTTTWYWRGEPAPVQLSRAFCWRFSSTDFPRERLGWWSNNDDGLSLLAEYSWPVQREIRLLVHPLKKLVGAFFRLRWEVQIVKLQILARSVGAIVTGGRSTSVAPGEFWSFEHATRGVREQHVIVLINQRDIWRCVMYVRKWKDKTLSYQIRQN